MQHDMRITLETGSPPAQPNFGPAVGGANLACRLATGPRDRHRGAIARSGIAYAGPVRAPAVLRTAATAPAAAVIALLMEISPRIPGAATMSPARKTPSPRSIAG